MSILTNPFANFLLILVLILVLALLSGEAMYSVITMNLMPAQIRREKLEGRDYLVVPTVMLTEGVHAGSEGPLLYEAQELSKDPCVWNHKPVTVHHPVINGRGVSACSKEMLEQQKIGLIMNSDFDSRLKCESWLDEVKAKTTEEGTAILSAVQNNKMVEVSTGLFHDRDKTAGVHNGEPYNGIVRNIRPDHLAILLNEQGACSIKDGAGLLRNAAAKIKAADTSYENLRERLRSILCESEGTDCFIYIADIYPDYVVYEHDGKMWKIGYKIRGDKVSISSEAPEKVRGVTTYVTANGSMFSSTENRTLALPEKSKVEVLFEEMIRNACSGVETEGDWDSWQLEHSILDDGSHVAKYSQNNLQKCLSYSIADDRIILNNVVSDVVSKENNMTAPATPPVPAKPTINNLPDTVGKLVTDAITAMDANLAELGNQLSAFRQQFGVPPAAPSAVPPPVIPVAPITPAANSSALAPVAPANLQAWMQTAPPEVQQLVNNAVQQQAELKKRYIQIIQAKEPTLNVEWLNIQPITTLRGMAKLAMPAVQTQQQGPVNNYVGQGEPPMYTVPSAGGPTDNALDAMTLEEDVLRLPTVNYAPAKVG